MGWFRMYLENDAITVKQEGVRDTRWFSKIDYEVDDEFIYLRCHWNENQVDYEVLFADFQNQDGNVVSNIPAYLAGIRKTKVDATLQDSTAPIIIVPFSKLIIETDLTASPALDDYVINVTSATSFVVGQLLTIYDIASNRVYFGKVLAINALAITLDSPIDFAFPIGSYVSVGVTNMAVDGSTTPQIFGVRNPSNEDIPLAVDITRIIFAMLTTTKPDLSQFGNIAGGLTRGVVLRKVWDGGQRNIFNAKTNAKLKSIMYDFDIQAATGSQQDGATGRLTFGGQEKLGAVIRIEAYEDLQMVIQDDLSSLNSYTQEAEGSEVIE